MVLETEVCFPGVPVTWGCRFFPVLSPDSVCVYKPVCIGTSVNLRIYNQLPLC